MDSSQNGNIADGTINNFIAIHWPIRNITKYLILISSQQWHRAALQFLVFGIGINRPKTNT
jgi:hypothetical protein